MKKPKVSKTTCQYEFIVNYKDIIPLNNKETPIPLKICSFDIEAVVVIGIPLTCEELQKTSGKYFGYLGIR